MPHNYPEGDIGVGTIVGQTWLQFRLSEIEVESDAAIVYRATPLQPNGYGFDDRDKVGDATFVVVLQQPLSPAIQLSTDRWQVAQKLLRRAMTLVDPAAAGFPEWNKLRTDDPVKLTQHEIGDIHWGAFQVSTHRRRLLKSVAEYRRPLNFSSRTRRSLLKASNYQCQHCGSGDNLEVDHIIPVAFGGPNQPLNGMVLCHVCHLKKSRAERRAFGLSIDRMQTRGSYPVDTFQDPSKYLQVLKQQSGWSPSPDVSEPVSG